MARATYLNAIPGKHATGPERLQGFTLIELLVVFALLALLLTIAVPRYLHSTEAAKERVRAQNIATLRDALDKFNTDQGRYPAALVELVQKQYLRQVPHDPVTQSDKWVTIPAPGGGESGIYDVAAPADDASGAPGVLSASPPSPHVESTGAK